jgi:hypothetical protein
MEPPVEPAVELEDERTEVIRPAPDDPTALH